MSKRIVSVHATKTQLSRLIAAAEACEEIVIARRDQPVARLVPIRKTLARRKFGVMKGRARVTFSRPTGPAPPARVAACSVKPSSEAHSGLS